MMVVLSVVMTTMTSMLMVCLITMNPMLIVNMYSMLIVTSVVILTLLFPELLCLGLPARLRLIRQGERSLFNGECRLICARRGSLLTAAAHEIL